MSKVYKSKSKSKSKSKTLTAVIAVVVTVVIIFGGTFAWQSISQIALNEVAAVRNPGGRLHDDFNNITVESNAKTMTFNKDVYAENFTTLAENGVQIFARVRLDEYMEFGVGAGNLNAANRDVESLVHGAELGDKTTWTTHIPDNEDDVFHKYWDWTLGGKTKYMPTFNKNKDSLEADINGTFDADFADFIDYANDTSKATQDQWSAIYDVDTNNNADELEQNKIDISKVIDGSVTLDPIYDQHVAVKQETHTVKDTLSADVITMKEWLSLPADKQTGDFWVWDTDGWAYWANPINPDTATGLLLDGISRTETIINDDWYYAINVVAQFITKEDMGKENGTGFYDTTAGKIPSSNALTLLNAIGVDVNTIVAEGDVADLESAFELGGNITIKGSYNATANNTTALGESYPVEYVWTTGGTLAATANKDADGNVTNYDGTLVSDGSAYAGLFINTENNYPAAGDGATEAIVNDITVTGNPTGYAVYAQAINANITLNDVAVSNTWGGGIFAEHGTSRVTLNNCVVAAATDSASNAPAYQKTAVAAASGANIVINSGEYRGEYAAYVYNTGGTITINGGSFRGKLAADAGKLVIKGGTFTVDPSAYVAEGYSAKKNADTGVWSVN